MSVAWLLFALSSFVEARTWQHARAVYVAEDTRLWSEPTRFGEPLARLRTGLELEVLEYTSGQSWLRVKTPSGREGWVLLRHTTQSGRRTLPANTEFVEERSSGGRGPASIPVEESAQDSSQSAGAADSVEWKSWEGQLAFEYMNEASRESSSGFGAELMVFRRMNSDWSLGGALGWHRFANSTQNEDFSTTRSTHRLSAQVLARYRWDSFRFDAGLGFASLRSNIRTFDKADGELIEFNEDGLRVSGSDSESALIFRLTPRFIFPMSRLLKVGVHVNYAVDWALGSSEGEFAGGESAVNPPFHLWGAGVSLAIDF